MAAILVIDSSSTIRETLRIVLGREHAVALAPTWDDVAPGTHADLVIFGVPPPPRDDAAAAAARARLAPDAPLLLLGAPAALDARALAPARHRVAFLPKPFDARMLRTQVAALLAPTARTPPPERVVARHRQWLEAPLLTATAATVAGRAALADLPVLVIGESGCGAVDVARAIHFFSGRDGDVAVRRARHVGPDVLDTASRATGALILEQIEDLPAEAQPALLALLRDPDDQVERPRIFATAAEPLDAAVARGTLAPELAHALSPLPIVLPPLRERTDDLPALIALFSSQLTERLRLEPIVFTAAAVSRMQRYLWFDNVAELEAVIARTLAVHRPRVVEPEMLLFATDGRDPGTAHAEPAATARPTAAPPERPEPVAKPAAPAAPPPLSPPQSPPRPRLVPLERRRAEEPAPEPTAPAQLPPAADAAASPALEVLLGELAHELRNPMVTIKTFAQHLDSVLDDPEVRTRFAALAGDAITRMDTILETLLDFARFRAPLPTTIDLAALAARALDERTDDLVAKGIRIEHADTEREATLASADELQVLFALRCLVDAFVTNLVPHTVLRADTGSDGALELAVRTDEAVATRLAAYVDDVGADGDAPPLAFALASALLRRNGGGLESRAGGGGTTIVTVRLPRAAARAEER
ncbi:MAG TPA: histidine kinase dimerization/phospho-acceptor domain-containing protein [Candidatus Binatia bacterium]|jgi:two-component system nitrogen regulation response regulator GlnG